MSRNHRRVASAVMLVVVFAAVLMWLRPRSTSSGVKIGVLMSVTGSGSVWGKNGRRGVELALEEVNRSGGVHGEPVQAVFDDTRSVPRDAISAFRRLIDQGIHLAVVDVISGDVLAIAPIAEQNKIVIISPGASNPKITTAGEFVFRNWPSDALQGELDARYAHEVLGWRKVAILAIRNEYGEALTRVFRDAFQARGGEIVYADQFAQGESDFRPLVTRLRSYRVDGLFIPAYPQEIPLLVRQLREQGVRTPLLGTESFQDASVIAGAGAAIEGAHFSIPASPDSSAGVVQRFRENFRARFAEDPGVPADVAYDAFHMLVVAARQVPLGTSGPALAAGVRDRLYAMRSYEGASGRATFDRNGDALKPFEFRTIRGGAFVAADRQLYDSNK